MALKRTTIKEVARAAGVSTQTVSRVINERPDVAPETRQRVLEVIAHLGFQPSVLGPQPDPPAQSHHRHRDRRPETHRPIVHAQRHHRAGRADGLRAPAERARASGHRRRRARSARSGCPAGRWHHLGGPRGGRQPAMAGRPAPQPAGADRVPDDARRPRRDRRRDGQPPRRAPGDRPSDRAGPPAHRPHRRPAGVVGSVRTCGGMAGCPERCRVCPRRKATWSRGTGTPPAASARSAN